MKFETFGIEKREGETIRLTEPAKGHIHRFQYHVSWERLQKIRFEMCMRIEGLMNTRTVVELARNS